MRHAKARKLPLNGELAHQGVGSFFLTLYGDSRHPTKARQGFLADAGMACYTFPGSGAPFSLAFPSEKTDNI